MAPCLSKLPDLCLEAIIKHMPLNDLFRSIGLVCRNWYKLRRAELKKRRRLVIVEDEEQLKNLNHNMLHYPYQTDLIRYVRRDDGSPWCSVESPEQIKFDAVIIPDGTFDIAATSSLMFMASVTHLTFMFKDVLNSTLIQVMRIIEHYSEHLIELKLSFSVDQEFLYCNDPDEANICVNLTNLLISFGRLPSLQHLGLHQYFSNFYDHIEELAFLPRLTTFSLLFENDDDDVLVFALLLPHVPMIDSCKIYNSVRLEDLLQVDTKLDTKFSVLSLVGPGTGDYDDMRLFCSRFISLTKLKFEYISMPLTMLARCLPQLPELVHLDLKLSYIPEIEVAKFDEEDELSEEEGEQSEEEEQSEKEEEESDEEGEQPQPEISQVLSVRMLNLDFETKSHHDTERLFIPDIFPNLQVLSLKLHLSECPDCAIRPLKDIKNVASFHRIKDSKFPHQLAECMRLAREPFRRCPNLHTVALVDSDGTETLIDINKL